MFFLMLLYVATSLVLPDEDSIVTDIVGEVLTVLVMVLKVSELGFSYQKLIELIAVSVNPPEVIDAGGATNRYCYFFDRSTK